MVRRPRTVCFIVKYFFGHIRGAYPVNGQQTWLNLMRVGDTKNLDDLAHFTHTLFKTMVLLGYFRERGSYGVNFMNQMGYLATH